jgi:hypothetical protein
MGKGKRSRPVVAVGETSLLKRLAIAASLFALTVGSFWLSVAPPASAQVSDKPSAAATTPTPSKETKEGSKQKTPSPVPWKRVPDAERKVLAPLETDWNGLPPHQQRRLLGAAKHFPTLAPIEQERFQERLKGWAALTPDQRGAARDKFLSLSNLPPAKQDELKARWQTEKQSEPRQTPQPPATAGK